jgi:RNA polymerase sigma-70 factor (ECF subfamily)
MSDPAALRNDELERLLFGIRPRLHRFCSRMLGSAIDGEDVAQDAVLKAIEALPRNPEVTNIEAWMFRIARNTALDHLRRRNRDLMVQVDDDADYVDPYVDTERGLQAAESLRQFMRLPPAQRAAVILADVIGYSLEDVAGIIETTVAAVKASLHRGRERLKQFADEPLARPLPALSEVDRRRLVHYVDRFNERDFDALRLLLAEDVRLDVRGERLHGRQVGEYYTRYADIFDVRLAPAIAEGQPVALVYRNDDLAYLVAFDWRDGQITKILDFRYAAYVLDLVEIAPFAA